MDITTASAASTLTTIRVLFQKTGENVTTAADPIRAFVDGADDHLLSIKESYCMSYDNDMLVTANKYEVHEVTLPSWLSVQSWADNVTAWKYLWGAGVDPTWCEAWQRGLRGLDMAECMAAATLLKTKNFRSEFRKSLRDQIVAWLETPAEERKYRSPLSARQWEALIGDRGAIAAKRRSEGLYRNRSLNCGAPVGA
jgi:hypothetical protein